MLIDVVEHTTDPLAMIIEAVAHLAPGGVIAIVTPDIGSFTARMMGRWWWHHRIGHVCFFNRRSMRRALSQAGVRPLADNFSGWRLPASYLCERLRAYLPLPPVSNLLRRLALSERLAELARFASLHRAERRGRLEGT